MPTTIHQESHFITHPPIHAVVPDGVTMNVEVEGRAERVRLVAHKSGLGHRVSIPASAYGEWIGPKKPGPVEHRDRIVISWNET